MATEARERPRHRHGSIHQFHVGEMSFFMTVSEYETGELCDIFLSSKQGSTMGGLLDTIAIVFSHALQNGCPLGDLLKGMAGMRYEPFGATQDPEIPEARSISDYIAKRLALDYLVENDPNYVKIFAS